MPKAEITTEVWGSGCIEQSVHTRVDNVVTRIQHTILDTRQEQTRKALMLIGWKPPSVELDEELTQFTNLLVRSNRRGASAKQVEDALDTALKLLGLEWT